MVDKALIELTKVTSGDLSSLSQSLDGFAFLQSEITGDDQTRLMPLSLVSDAIGSTPLVESITLANSDTLSVNKPTKPVYETIVLSSIDSVEVSISTTSVILGKRILLINANTTGYIVVTSGVAKDALITPGKAFSLVFTGTNWIAETASPETLLKVFYHYDYTGSDPDPGIHLSVGGFNTFVMPSVDSDICGSYNVSTGLYTLPATASYLIFSKFRLKDNTPLLSYGQGVHSSNIDGSWFTWWSPVTTIGSGSNRNSSENFRVSDFTKGDQLRLYYYLDYSGSDTIACVDAEMTVIKMS